MCPNLPVQFVAPTVRYHAVAAAPVWHLAAFVLVAAFFTLQATTLDYGTTINNLPHIARYEVKPGAAIGDALERKTLVTTPRGGVESLDRWMMRFKLYSVEPDDVVNIMALARVRPGELKLDPGFYQYGGAYLYPLGAWYAVLSTIGVIEAGSLDAMLAAPDRMDGVYVYGRLFVLIGFALSAFVLWRVLNLVAAPEVALIGLAIYLTCPATIMFSQVLKPHWYALLWTNLAMLGVTALFARRRWSAAAMTGTGIAIGLAVGSATTFGLFSLLVWAALAVAVARGIANWKTLVWVPLAAFAAFAVTNPYVLLNYSAAAEERATAWREWFSLALSPKLVGLFVYNSLLPALGVALAAVLLGAAVLRAARPAQKGERWFATGILVTVVVLSVFTAGQADWHTNLRYAPYLLAGGLVFLAATPLPRKPVLLGAVLALTAAQAVPTLLIYRDADDPRHATRLLAARWIEVNVPAGTAIRLGTATPSPYEVPPFDLAKYRINGEGPTYFVVVHGERPKADPDGFKLVRRFRPRLGTDRFPLTFGFANPSISIYRAAAQ